MKKVLLTGFEPFLGFKYNTSWEAIKGFRAKVIKGYQLDTLCLPTVFEKARLRLIAGIEERNPEIILAFGMSNQSRIAIERVALNLADAQHPDNQGLIPGDQPIRISGPFAYSASIPLKIVYQKLKDLGYQTLISNSAGTYVCNDVFYGLMDYITNNHPRSVAGFIHVPQKKIKRMNWFSPWASIGEVQTYLQDYPYLTVHTLKKIVRIIVEAVIDHVEFSQNC